MRNVMRGLGILLTIALVWFLIQMIASESEEVVVLTTIDASGENKETRVWVVDYEEGQWLRSGSDVQSWYQNLLERPEVAVLRGTERRSYTAVPAVEQREAINRLMEKKYGWAESYIGSFFSRENAIPIRLDPR